MLGLLSEERIGVRLLQLRLSVNRSGYLLRLHRFLVQGDLLSVADLSRKHKFLVQHILLRQLLGRRVSPRSAPGR